MTTHLAVSIPQKGWLVVWSLCPNLAQGAAMTGMAPLASSFSAIVVPKPNHERGTYYDLRSDRPPDLDKDLDPRRLCLPEPELYRHGDCSGRADQHVATGLWHHLGNRSRTVPWRRCLEC